MCFRDVHKLQPCLAIQSPLFALPLKYFIHVLLSVWIEQNQCITFVLQTGFICHQNTLLLPASHPASHGTLDQPDGSTNVFEPSSSSSSVISTAVQVHLLPSYSYHPPRNNSSIIQSSSFTGRHRSVAAVLGPQDVDDGIRYSITASKTDRSTQLQAKPSRSNQCNDDRCWWG